MVTKKEIDFGKALNKQDFRVWNNKQKYFYNLFSKKPVIFELCDNFVPSLSPRQTQKAYLSNSPPGSIRQPIFHSLQESQCLYKYDIL